MQSYPHLTFSALVVRRAFHSFSASDSSMLVGPSSSHTVGPMRAAKIFITDLKDLSLLEKAGNTFA